jgi:hypothetical protein
MITVNLAQYARLFLGWLDHTKEDAEFLRVLHEAAERTGETLTVSTDEDVIAQVQSYFEQQIAAVHP